MTGAMTALVIKSAATRPPAPIVLPIVTPIVTPVNVSMPPPLVHIAAPAVESSPVRPDDRPAPEPSPPPQPRALVPTIDGACILPVPDEQAEQPTTCAWHDGFPAISADGSTIVTKYYPDDGGRGNPGLSIRFIDVKTSRVVSAERVLSPDEFDGEGEDRARLQKLIARRVTRIQRTIDAGGFRSLVPLGGGGSGGDTVESDPKQIHAEHIGTTVRIVDPASSSVLWRRDLALDPPAHVEEAAARTDLCGAWTFHDLAVWWDPATRIVLASLTYLTGGCLCPGETHERVHRIAAAASRAPSP